MANCKKCGNDDRYPSGGCKKCTANRKILNPEKTKQYAAKYTKNNSAILKEKNLAWREKNKDRVKEYEKKQREVLKNTKPDYRAEYMQSWRKKNPDKNAIYAAKYNKKNRLKNAERRNKWKLLNPNKAKVYSSNRRARELSSNVKLSVDLVEKLYDLQLGRCACCGVKLGDDFHLDHIMPLALGGENIDGNMQLLKSICNLEKHAKHPVDFMQSRGFLL